MEIARVIRETERELPNRHLISAQEAFAYHLDDESERGGPGVFQFADRGFTMDAVDIVNMHPADNMRYRGRSYDLGEFMQGNLKLAELQRYCLDLYAEPKPLNLDEDNSASQYKNTMGWTVHRKRAWTALFCGAHYDAIDFSIVNGFETGTEESRRGLRAWFGHLARFIHGLDLVRARPMPELIGVLPEHIVGSVLAIPGECYELYLADCRERDEPGAGEMIAGQVVLDLADRTGSLLLFTGDGPRVAGGATAGRLAHPSRVAAVQTGSRVRMAPPDQSGLTVHDRIKAAHKHLVDQQMLEARQPGPLPHLRGELMLQQHVQARRDAAGAARDRVQQIGLVGAQLRADEVALLHRDRGPAATRWPRSAAGARAAGRPPRRGRRTRRGTGCHAAAPLRRP